MSGPTGTTTLLRLAWRRDRVLIPVAVAAIAGVAVASVAATIGLYSTATSIGPAVQRLLANPAARALYGPVSDPNSRDAFAVYKTTLMGAVFIALLAAAIVRRHTRVEEEHGRLDLLGAAVVARRAPLVAASALAALAVVATCLMTAVGYAATGADPAGSFASAAGWAATGFAFVGIAALTAQVAATGRGAAGATAGILVVAYLFRAVVDSRDGAPAWLGWVSPVAWSQRADAFDDNRAWVALVGLAFMVVCLVLADRMLDHRDLGGGMLRSRPGPARGAARLASPLALATRLHRAGAAGWTIMFVVFGAVVGALTDTAADMLDDPDLAELLRRLGGGGAAELRDLFVATELGFAAMVAAAYVVATLLRLRAEETAGHVEQLLATAISRLRLVGTQALVALLGGAGLLAVIGVTIGIVDRGADARGPIVLAAAALGHLPAIAVCAGLTLLVLGHRPRHAGAITWGVFAGFVVLAELGPVLELPGWLIDLSPFVHTPRLPGADVDVWPMFALTGVGVALAIVGVLGYRRRDIG